MLKVIIPKQELYNSKTKTFFDSKETTLQIEHSLISISKWEARYHKPFFSEKEKTVEETLFYIECMLLKPISTEVLNYIDQQILNTIMEYINNPMSATVVAKQNSKRSSSFVTSELIYFWMTSYNIPFECEKWHINRLLKLIEVCNAENAPKKQKTKGQILRENAAMNKARRAKRR